MRSFTERNPVVIGAVVVTLIAAFTGAALMLNSGVLADRYTVRARFSDSAGITPGSHVKVAGITSGAVESVRQEGTEVEVVLGVDAGIELPADTRADIVVDTLLGSKSVRLVPGDEWDDLLQEDAVITDTSTPTEALDLQNIGTPLLEETDGEAIDSLIDTVLRITEGKRDDVADILDGLEDLAVTINAREQEARDLIDATRTLTATLDARDEELLDAVDDLNVVVETLVRRRAELVELLRQTSEAATRISDLVEENQPALDRILDELHADLEIVGRHQVDLAQSVALVSSAIQGFASVGYSGPDEVSHPWANLYTQLLGPVGPDILLGSCGAIDTALDLALGPDPVVDCDDRTGPLPGSPGPGQPGSGGSGGGSTEAESDSTGLLGIYGPALAATPEAGG
ncbi:MCE family protein [Iamia sp. SCSIO 61187]|uniref:MlaD family protein n=1 Tax=Iamia sp. SCSIO 61187 TaxID=2722752 RepID=UPI001C635667|nr:MlaD family protein [Iamia sp. SCSIO 61187]QYG92928.1 MCE family protein [Iamia sp. SCSIO 61187]